MIRGPQNILSQYLLFGSICVIRLKIVFTQCKREERNRRKRVQILTNSKLLNIRLLGIVSPCCVQQTSVSIFWRRWPWPLGGLARLTCASHFFPKTLVGQAFPHVNTVLTASLSLERGAHCIYMLLILWTAPRCAGCFPVPTLQDRGGDTRPQGPQTHKGMTNRPCHGWGKYRVQTNDKQPLGVGHSQWAGAARGKFWR